MHLSILNLFTERTNNTEDIPGEIVGGSTLEKLIEFGMREGGTRYGASLGTFYGYHTLI